MTKIIFTFLLIFYNANVFAQTVANCTDPEGFANYHFSGAVSKKSSGLQKDKISGGITTFVKMPDGKFDILIVDARKKVISLVQDGGRVALLRSGKRDATFLHFHPNMAIEIYTLYIENDGRYKFDIVQSKGGDNMPVHKSSVMVGSCDSIDLSLIE